MIIARGCAAWVNIKSGFLFWEQKAKRRERTRDYVGLGLVIKMCVSEGNKMLCWESGTGSAPRRLLSVSLYDSPDSPALLGARSFVPITNANTNTNPNPNPFIRSPHAELRPRHRRITLRLRLRLKLRGAPTSTDGICLLCWVFQEHHGGRR